MFSQWMSLNSSKYSYNNAYFIENGVMGLGMEMLKKQEWTEFSRWTSAYISTFSVETPLNHGGAIDYLYFQYL